MPKTTKRPRATVHGETTGESETGAGGQSTSRSTGQATGVHVTGASAPGKSRFLEQLIRPEKSKGKKK